jgi:hypothetical protein
MLHILELEKRLKPNYFLSIIGAQPPNFVKVWGETLHKELGIDPPHLRRW